jgi:hypothetical protein
MMGPVWRLEWALAFRRRRLLALNVVIPLLLVVPIALGGAPAFHAAAAYTVLFVLFATFGSAIPLVRDGEGGLLRRTLLAGGSGRAILIPRILAGALLDTLQLLPATLLILATGGGSLQLWLLAPMLLLGAVLAGNLVGVWVAAGARSLAEGALFAAVVSLFLLHASGVFRTPAPGSVAATLEPLLPFTRLHQLLLAGAGGPPLPLNTVPDGFVGTWGGALLLLALTAVVAQPLIKRISNP